MAIFSLLLEKQGNDYYYKYIKGNINYYIPSYKEDRLNKPLSSFKSFTDYYNLRDFLDTVYKEGEYSENYTLSDVKNNKEVLVELTGYRYGNFLILIGSPKTDKLLEEPLFKEDYIFLVRWVQNKDEHIEDVSDNIINLLGYTKKEILSKHYIELVHPDDVSTFNKELTDHITLNTPSFYQRYRLITKSGKPITILDHTCQLVKENTKSMVGYLRDITLDNERANQLKELIRLNEEDFNNSLLIKIEWDNNFNIIRWNTEAKNIFGWGDEILNKNIRETGLFSDLDSISMQNQLTKLLNNEVLNTVNIFKIKKKDGGLINTKWSNKLISKDGKLRVCSSIIDQSQEMLLTNRLDEMEGRTDLLLKTLENTQMSNDVFSKLIHNPLTSNPEGLIKAEIIIRKLEEEINRLNNTIFYNNDNNLLNDVAFLKNQDQAFKEKLAKIEENNNEIAKELDNLLNIKVLTAVKNFNTRNIIGVIAVGYIIFGQLIPSIYPTIIKPTITMINKELKHMGGKD